MDKKEYLNELLLVSRIIYSLLNMANHMKVEAHFQAPKRTTLNSPYPIMHINLNKKYTTIYNYFEFLCI
jgi:hypothetical protein